MHVKLLHSARDHSAVDAQSLGGTGSEGGSGLWRLPILKAAHCVELVDEVQSFCAARKINPANLDVARLGLRPTLERLVAEYARAPAGVCSADCCCTRTMQVPDSRAQGAVQGAALPAQGAKHATD